MLQGKAKLPNEVRKQTDSWREQLVEEFSKALESGELRTFVLSLGKALQQPAERYNVESAASAFLINGWLYPEAPLCCFTHEALASLLAIVFKNEDIDFKAVAKRCQRLHLRQVQNPPVSLVLEPEAAVKLGAA